MLKNYFCSKCRTLVERESQPVSNNCLGKGMHQWVNIAPVGDKTYQCGKCGVMVNVNASPISNNRPEGGAHRWQRI